MHLVKQFMKFGFHTPGLAFFFHSPDGLQALAFLHGVGAGAGLDLRVEHCILAAVVAMELAAVAHEVVATVFGVGDGTVEVTWGTN
jgi:hypothetical protein